MGIAEDFESLKTNWSSLSGTSKVLFLASACFSFLSIASLADNIYKMKGFLAETIEFWRWICSYVIEITKYLGLSLEQWQMDYWAIICIVFIPYTISRWAFFGTRGNIIRFSIFLAALYLPFVKGQLYSMVSASFIYVSTLLVILYPPRTREFNLIAVRMVLPPLGVAIVAAVVEGISRPI
ncbi:TPA: hypothetical protein I7753_21265 [Vibrio vulnificus]|nr:hypothetical protein [Vibrio vulnificus]